MCEKEYLARAKTQVRVRGARRLSPGSVGMSASWTVSGGQAECVNEKERGVKCAWADREGLRSCWGGPRGSRRGV